MEIKVRKPKAEKKIIQELKLISGNLINLEEGYPVEVTLTDVTPQNDLEEVGTLIDQTVIDTINWKDHKGLEYKSLETNDLPNPSDKTKIVTTMNGDTYIIPPSATEKAAIKIGENDIKETQEIKLKSPTRENNSWNGIYGEVGESDNWIIRGSQKGTNEGYLELATGDDGTEPIYVSQYGVNGVAQNCYEKTLTNTTNRRTLTLLNEEGNTIIPGKVTINNNLYINEDSSIIVENKISGKNLEISGKTKTGSLETDDIKTTNSIRSYGTLEVGGQSYFNHTINATGSAIISGQLNVGGTTNLTGELKVGKITQLNTSDNILCGKTIIGEDISNGSKKITGVMLNKNGAHKRVTTKNADGTYTTTNSPYLTAQDILSIELGGDVTYLTSTNLENYLGNYATISALNTKVDKNATTTLREENYQILNNTYTINFLENLYNAGYQAIKIEVNSYTEEGDDYVNYNYANHGNTEVRIKPNNENDASHTNTFSFQIGCDEYYRYWIEGKITNQTIQMQANKARWDQIGIKSSMNDHYFNVKIIGKK